MGPVPPRPSLACDSPTYGQALSQEEINLVSEISRRIMGSSVTLTNAFGANNVFTNVDVLLNQAVTAMQALTRLGMSSGADCIMMKR